MACEIGLFLHLQGFNNKWVEVLGPLSGRNQSAAWHSWKPGPCSLNTALIWGCLLRDFSFCSSALLELTPKSIGPMHLVPPTSTLICNLVKLFRVLMLLLTLTWPSPNSSSSAVLTPSSVLHFPNILTLLMTCWPESHLWPLSVFLLLHLLCCQILYIAFYNFLSLCLSWHVHYQQTRSGHSCPMDEIGIPFDIVHCLVTRDILTWEHHLVKDRVKDMERSKKGWGESQGWVVG